MAFDPDAFLAETSPSLAEDTSDSSKVDLDSIEARVNQVATGQYKPMGPVTRYEPLEDKHFTPDNPMTPIKSTGAFDPDAFLAETSIPSKEKTDKGIKDTVTKGQVYVTPAWGMSAKQTAGLYAFAERASAGIRGIGQLLGIGEERVTEEVQKRKALEASPTYGTVAKTGAVLGTIAEPLTYAVPLGKAKTLGEFVKQSALLGGGVGFVSAADEETSRGTEAVQGAIGGAVGGAVLGTVIRQGGKLFGKDWLPWKATPKEKEAVEAAIKAEDPTADTTAIRHFMDAPADSHINAKTQAEKLILEGASKKTTEAAMKKNPLVAHYLQEYQARYNALKESPLGTTKQGEVLPPEGAPTEPVPRVGGGTPEGQPQIGEVIPEGRQTLPDEEAIQRVTSEMRETHQASEAANRARMAEAELQYATEQAAKNAPVAPGQEGIANVPLLANVAGAGVGAVLNPEDPLTGAALGLGVAYGSRVLAGKLLSKVADVKSPVGEFFSALGEGTDKALGQLGTRLSNESAELGRRALDVERKMKQDTYAGITVADPFFKAINKVDKAEIERLKGAWLNGSRQEIEKSLAATGDKEAISSFQKVTKVLDTLGEELAKRGIIKGKISGYLPRIVKDKEGLLQSLDIKTRTAIGEALNKAERAKGMKLDDLEMSEVINKFLKTGAPIGAGKAGFTKGRVFQEVSPEMQQFYHSPTETYHSYVNRAVSEIHTADFFGKSKVVKDGAIDVDASIGNYLNKLLAEKKIKEEQFDTVKSLLETRYKFGNQIANKYIQEYKNWTTGMLLADVGSSIQNLGDLVLANFIYGMKPALTALTYKLSGKQQLSVKDFGLMDHIAEEFVSSTKSKVYVDKVMKMAGWGIFDPLGKEVALNSSLIRAQNWTKSEKGMKNLQDRYADAYGSDFPALVKDLKEGTITDLTKSMAFFDVTRHQPLTKLQKTELATRNPNLGGLVYQFKSFMLSQANLVRQEAYNEIKKGNTAQGLKKLASIGVGFAAVGATNNQIQNFLLGKNEPFTGVDMFYGATKQFGLTEYTVRKIKGGDIKGAIGSVFSPPTALLEGWTTEKEVARKIPIVGRELSARYFTPTPKEERAKKKQEKKQERIEETAEERFDRIQAQIEKRREANK